MSGRKRYAFHVFAVLAAVFVIASNVRAVPPGKTVEWKTSMGKVVFDGRVHADRGFECVRCHPKIFEEGKGPNRFKMADIKMGKFCGECHNGTEAFSAKEGFNCKRCHKRR